MTRPITVTVADLEAAVGLLLAHGRPFDRCGECLMAVALSRCLKQPSSVGMETGWVHGDGVVVGRIDLPAPACELIDLFDNEEFDHIRTLLPVTFGVVVQTR